MSEKDRKKSIQILNRKASHEYFIGDTYEAGMVLNGCEVKSIRNGNVSITASFCKIIRNEIYIFGMHIAPYEQGNRNNLDPLRERKLLLSKKEIAKISREISEKGKTIVPLKLYFSRSYAKLLIGIGTGKKLWDKRDSIATKDANRDKERALSARNRE